MPAPHNAVRGEVLLTIDGVERRLCVTLGALAELEAAFDVVSLTELSERLAQLTASDLLIVLSALCGGGGEPASTEELASAQIDAKAAANAVARAFQAAFANV